MARSKFAWIALVCATFGFNLLATATCYDTTAGTVRICSPVNGSHHLSPVLDSSAAAATSGTSINNLQAWIDGSKMAQTSGPHMDVYIPLTPGWHNLTEIAFENNGLKLSAKSGFSVFNHEFAYTVDVLGVNGNESGYSAALSSGALTATPGSPYVGDTAQSQVAVLGGQYLYVNSNDGAGAGLVRYSVNGTTGQLTLLGFSQNGWPSGFRTQGQPVAADAGGLLVYIGGVASDPAETPEIDVLRVNSDGSNTEFCCPASFSITSGYAAEPDAMAIDPYGKFLYVFSPYQRDSATVLPTPHLLSIVRDSYGLLGKWTYVNTPECSSEDTPSLAVTPNGKYLLLNCGVNYFGQTFMGIQVYSVNRTTGQLTYVNHFATHPVRAIALDHTGKYVFAAEDTAGMLQVFSLNGSTGALTLLGSHATGKYPSSVAVDVSNNYIYVTNGGNCYPKQIANGNCSELNPSNDINGWRLNYSTGALTTLSGSPFSTGAGARAMIFIPR